MHSVPGPVQLLLLSLLSFLEKSFERKIYMFMSSSSPLIPSSTFNCQASTLLLDISPSGKDPHYFLIAKFNRFLLSSTLFYPYAVFVIHVDYSYLHFYKPIFFFPSAVPIFLNIFHLKAPTYTITVIFSSVLSFLLFSLSLDDLIHMHSFNHNLFTEDPKATVLIQSFPLISNAVIYLVLEAQQAPHFKSV